MSKFLSFFLLNIFANILANQLGMQKYFFSQKLPGVGDIAEPRDSLLPSTLGSFSFFQYVTQRKFAFKRKCSRVPVMGPEEALLLKKSHDAVSLSLVLGF